jgi:hypothetical protein
MSQAGSDTKRKRIPEIDFWRGFALIVILVDHIPWNGLDDLTPQNFGFSDAAEAFVFLSGVSVSLAYAPTLQNAGFGCLVRRCATRAAQLYLVQLAMVACSIAIPLAAAKLVGDENVVLGQGLSRFVNAPLSSLVGAFVRPLKASRGSTQYVFALPRTDHSGGSLMRVLPRSCGRI